MNFKDFSVDCEIGHGSFGLVHKALWRGTEVAVKRLPRESITDPQILLEFMKEAFIMRQLRHPNVLQVLGVCTDPPCIIMEYMPRGSLHQLIHNPSTSLDWPIVRKLAIEICRGMAYLHNCNPPLIHRDLKPHNLLVDEMWRVKVCDFGLSRFWEAKKDMTACGTPAYAAPEVLRNAAYSVSADVYSFAMVLWELITRQPLYPGMPPFQIIFTVGTQGLRPTLPPTCNSGLASVIRDCWAEDPSQRPSFIALADRISQLPSDT
jgi:serine/threonine protein kinase